MIKNIFYECSNNCNAISLQEYVFFVKNSAILCTLESTLLIISHNSISGNSCTITNVPHLCFVNPLYDFEYYAHIEVMENSTTIFYFSKVRVESYSSA